MLPRLIAHQIIKEQHEVKKAEVILRDALLPTDTEIAKTLIAQLGHSITQRNPQAGKFSTPANEQPPFQKSVIRYRVEQSDIKFVEFSHNVTRYLRTMMDDQPQATGGYLLFAEHDHGGERLLLLVLLSTHAQPWFDAAMNLQSAHTLNLEHIRHGARIRYSGVATNEDGVVHFVSKSAKGVSNYFQSFLGCEPLTDSAAQGRYLLTAVKQIAATLKLDRDDLLQRTYSYWKGCQKSDIPMTMTSLANTLVPEDPQRALVILGDPLHRLAGEFSPPARSVMKFFLKFEFNADGLRLGFERDQWLDNITVRERSITIRNAPQSLIDQLKDDAL